MKLSHQLTERINEIANLHKLKPDEAFALWFLTAWTTTTEADARTWLCGGTGDRGADALLIDDRTESITLLQAKWRTAGAGKADSKELVQHPAIVAGVLFGGGEQLEEFISRRAPHFQDLFRRSHKKLSQGWTLQVIYLTTGTVSEPIRRVASDTVSSLSVGANFVAYTWDELDLLWSDYLAGAAPPIPPFQIQTEAETDPLQRIDPNTELETWIVAARGDQIGQTFKRFGDRLFARNIRGDMGDASDINAEIFKTIRTRPQDFFYLNNGLTVLCDKVMAIKEGNSHLIRLENAQIVNGQQTTRALARDPVASRRATVLVKIIKFDRVNSTQDFDEELSLIVQGTNRQNRITPSDLWSNELRQVMIEREMRRLGYHFLRKRQTKSSAWDKWLGSSPPKLMIKKEDLAQYLAATNRTLSADLVSKEGRDGLFDKDYYYDVFRSKNDIEFYVAVAQLGRLVTQIPRQMKPKKHGWRDLRWAVLRWFALNTPYLLAKGQRRAVFINAAEEDRAVSEFRKLTKMLFKIGLDCYESHLKTNKASVYDMHDYFRTPESYREYARRTKRDRRLLKELARNWLAECVSG